MTLVIFRLVCAARPHARTIERVVELAFSLGWILRSCKGKWSTMMFLDMRNGNHVYLTIDAHRGSLTALAVQQHAPLIASGSAKQFIKVFSLEGSQRCTIRFNPTSIARKIGPVSHLTFHPYQVLLAAGAADALVSIYGNDNSQVSRSAAPIPLHTQCFWKCSVHAVLKLYAIYSLASIG
ncbi:Regulatory-associated protein of TOR 1 [Vitis vinifera]|uniref:Regulatory-associated protein of TOR 1 n=1 Tax=Vitis vinifera TaxID=29760 RepID=A0A438IVE1_VITVI|nr:Regulatory-associated protein of TOR 1 [Vitis vinifera]